MSSNDEKEENGEQVDDRQEEDKKCEAVSGLRYKDCVNDGVISERHDRTVGGGGFLSSLMSADASTLTTSAQAILTGCNPEDSFLSAGRRSSSSSTPLFAWTPHVVQHSRPSDVVNRDGDVPMVVAKPIHAPTREAELQARIAQLEQQDRQRSTDTDTSKTKVPSRSIHESTPRWLRSVLIAAAAVLFLLMVILVPVFTIPGQENPPVVFLNSSQQVIDTIRSSTLVSITTTLAGDSSSLEGKALAWVLKEYETGTTKFTRETLLQRYTVASILFASPRQQFDHNHECTWPGVKCDKAQGKVTELHLPYFGLAGTLPPDVGLLTSLNRLRMENNTLTGPLPDSIGNLSHLIVLHLFNNALTGTIPSALSRLSELVELRCGQNEFTGPLDPTRLSPSLAWISFFRNHLTGSIPESLGRLSSVQALILSHNQLTGSLPVALWTQLSQLSHLLLNDNRLTGRLPGSYDNMRLERLELRDNLLTGEIPRWTARVSDLDLYGNNFTNS